MTLPYGIRAFATAASDRTWLIRLMPIWQSCHLAINAVWESDWAGRDHGVKSSEESRSTTKAASRSAA